MNLIKLPRFVCLTVLAPLFLTACAGVPSGVEPVTGFELNRYLGTWYEIARLDHSFERGLTQVTANYNLRDDDGVEVINRGYNTSDAEWSEAIGKAYFVGEAGVGQLKVSFFGPFYGGYNIFELDKTDYQYSLVAGPNKKFLWLLSRTPQMDQAKIDELVTKASELGFATDELIFVDHKPM